MTTSTRRGAHRGAFLEELPYPLSQYSIPLADHFFIATEKAQIQYMYAMLNPFRTRLPHPDSDSLDSDTLLPSSASATLEHRKRPRMDRHGRGIQIAVRTLVLCTVIYFGAALWVGFGVRKMSIFVADADSFCMHHDSLYCEWGETA